MLDAIHAMKYKRTMYRTTIVTSKTHVYPIISFLLLCFSLTACDSSDTISIQTVDEVDLLSDIELQQLQQSKAYNTAPQTYSFGFNLRASPQEDTAQYLPFLDYLEKATGYHFKLHFTPKGSTAADELGENKTQFAAIGATSFLYAESRYGVTLLARGINPEGKAKYQSIFVVKPSSTINSIKDIKNHKLAFGSADSTQGHLIPRIMLAEHGIALDSLQAYGYTGSHQNCAESVVSGKYDICGMQDQLAKKLAADGIIKIIHYSREYPSSGIVANQFVPKEVMQRVKQALLDFKPQGGNSQNLYHWNRTEMAKGFISANDTDYDDLRRWSIQLGFLPQNTERDK